MSRMKRLMSATLAILMLLIGASSVLAGSSAHKVVHETVNWILPSGICAVAPNGLSGSGERHQVKDTKVNSDGSTEITINDLVTGSAWDSTGTYKFVYTNHSVEVVPAGPGAHQVTMADSFVINGNGSVKHMEVGFNWRWTYTPPADMWPPKDNWQKISTRGDPLNCDPI